MAIGATVSIAGGVIQRHQASKAEEEAREKADKAAKQLAKDKEAFKNLDTSNPYLNMENTMEDLTVNQQEAEFQKQQQQQNQANIMDSMRGAAGSSGVAGLAQTLANQGSLDAQKASASIGRQEAENQKLAAQEDGRIQGLEREGEIISRNAKADIASTMLGMTAQEMQAFQSQQAAAQAGMNAGSAQIAQGASMIGQIDTDGKSMFAKN